MFECRRLPSCPSPALNIAILLCQTGRWSAWPHSPQQRCMLVQGARRQVLLQFLMAMEGNKRGSTAHGLTARSWLFRRSPVWSFLRWHYKDKNWAVKRGVLWEEESHSPVMREKGWDCGPLCRCSSEKVVAMNSIRPRWRVWLAPSVDLTSCWFRLLSEAGHRLELRPGEEKRSGFGRSASFTVN